MANVLVVAEFAEGKVKKTTHSAITFAQSVAKALPEVVEGGHITDTVARVKGYARG
jgi:electron transfer flavoprotein alpha subunit